MSLLRLFLKNKSMKIFEKTLVNEAKCSQPDVRM